MAFLSRLLEAGKESQANCSHQGQGNRPTGRRVGNYVKAVISIVFAWGAERGYVASNPAEKVRNIRRKKGSAEANRPWADEEREAVLKGAPAHMLPAIGLMMFTGLGPKDALREISNFPDIKSVDARKLLRLMQKGASVRSKDVGCVSSARATGLSQPRNS